jgi:uncharacterized protein
MSTTSIVCEGCGVCCERVGYPPFLIQIPEADARFASLQELFPDRADEVLQAAAERRRENGLPCVWLDPATKRCRHYELRPRICREFELGSPKCLELRWLKGIG